MFTYTLRRLAIAVPTLIVISFIIFLILELSPGDPMAQVPLTVPQAERVKIAATLGLDRPFHIRYLLWLNQFFINEPLNFLQEQFGIVIGDPDRLRSARLGWGPVGRVRRGHSALGGPVSDRPPWTHARHRGPRVGCRCHPDQAGRGRGCRPTPPLLCGAIGHQPVPTIHGSRQRR